MNASIPKRPPGQRRAGFLALVAIVLFAAACWVKYIDIPYYTQETSYWCGAASAQMVLDGDVRRQDSFWVVATMFGHRENGPRIWELMKENWDDLLGQMPPSTGRRILDPLPRRSEPDVAKDIEAWLADHAIMGGEKYAEQQLELLKVRVGLRERESTRLGEVLSTEYSVPEPWANE